MDVKQNKKKKKQRTLHYCKPTIGSNVEVGVYMKNINLISNITKTNNQHESKHGDLLFSYWLYLKDYNLEVNRVSVRFQAALVG